LYYTSEIRNIVCKYKTDKLTLLWIPGHCGIKGNNLADTTAKNTHIFPLITECNYNPSDVSKYINQNLQTLDNTTLTKASPYYKLICHEKATPEIVKNTSRTNFKKFSRIRLGHTNLTHNYILNKSPPTLCPNCNIPLTICHIFIDCPLYHNERTNHLDNTIEKITSYKHLNKTIDFLKATNLYHLI